MVISLKKLRMWFVFIIKLILITIVIYYVLHALQAWMTPSLQYKTPEGYSVKVFQNEGITDEKRTMKQQLSQFYWIGE